MSTNDKKRFTLERTFENTTVEDVWALWTTKDGIESWWGPEGFTVTVNSIDLRPKGVLFYTMTATAAPQVEFMKKAGMPLATDTRITYTEVVPQRRLSYDNLADFIPGVAAYDVGTTVEIEAKGGAIHMRVIIDAMHDQVWTDRMVMGWESQLGKLARLLTGTAAPR